MYTGGMPGNGMVPATGEQPAQQQMVYATSSQYMPTVQQPCPSGAPAMNTSMPRCVVKSHNIFNLAISGLTVVSNYAEEVVSSAF